MADLLQSYLTTHDIFEKIILFTLEKNDVQRKMLCRLERCFTIDCFCISQNERKCLMNVFNIVGMQGFERSVKQMARRLLLVYLDHSKGLINRNYSIQNLMNRDIQVYSKENTVTKNPLFSSSQLGA